MSALVSASNNSLAMTTWSSYRTVETHLKRCEIDTNVKIRFPMDSREVFNFLCERLPPPGGKRWIQSKTKQGDFLWNLGTYFQLFLRTSKLVIIMFCGEFAPIKFWWLSDQYSSMSSFSEQLPKHVKTALFCGDRKFWGYHTIKTSVSLLWATMINCKCNVMGFWSYW